MLFGPSIVADSIETIKSSNVTPPLILYCQVPLFSVFITAMPISLESVSRSRSEAIVPIKLLTLTPALEESSMSSIILGNVTNPDCGQSKTG